VSVSSHQSRAHPTIPEQSPRIAVPPTMQEMVQHASCVNGALLDDPGAHFCAYEILDPGDVTFSYVRTPGARFLLIRTVAPAVVTSGFGTHTVALDMLITDGTTTITSADARIPQDYRGNTRYVPPSAPGRSVDGLLLEGHLDLDALVDTGLASYLDPSVAWAITVTITFGGAAEVLVMHGWEVPGFVVDPDTAGRGVPLDFFGRDVPIIDAPEGVEALVDADDAALQLQRTLINLSWRRQVSDVAETPNMTGTSFVDFALLDESGGSGILRVRARRIEPESAAGEPIRWRALYRMSGGTTETATIRLVGNATGSPWATSGLTYTSSWTWTPWITAATATNGAEDSLGVQGKLSGAGPSLWIAAIHVMEAAAP